MRDHSHFSDAFDPSPAVVETDWNKHLDAIEEAQAKVEHYTLLLFASFFFMGLLVGIAAGAALTFYFLGVHP